MKTQAIVVAEDPVYQGWLQNAVGQGADFSLVRPVDAEDLLERIQAAGRIELALFQFDAHNVASRVALVERLLERHPDLPVVGLGASGEPEVVLAAMRAGARDFFVLKRDDANLPELLSRVLRRAVTVQRASAQPGRLFALLAGHPYEGLAFNGTHLALACAERVGASGRTILVDLATPAGAAAVFLNINQSYSVLDAVNDVYRCDQTLVDTAFARHGSGLYLLSLPEDLIGRPTVNPDEIVKLFEVFRSMFAVTVVTLDGHLPVPALTAIVAQADRTLLITDQSILKSRHNKYLLRALRLQDCPLDRAGLVVDNFRRRLGLEPENLAQLLDLPLLATLSGKGDQRIVAKNSGEPMFTVAPKDEYCRDIRRLTAAVMSGPAAQPATEPPQGLLDKLFG